MSDEEMTWRLWSDPPDNEDDVLVVNSMVSCCAFSIGWWNGKENKWENTGRRCITHWMPLPTPPKEDSL